jgi:TolB-like protein/DNA-binding CsgD family transcriptional regulator
MDRPRASRPADAAEPLPPERPSIAVLPFADTGDEDGHRHVGDGITEDVITELSRFREIAVIALGTTMALEAQARDPKTAARELGVRYVLEGSVRRAGERLRISAQLVDGERGEGLWAERYDGTMQDIFGLQEEIARRIVSAISAEVQFAELSRIERLGLGDLQAYDLATQATALINRGIGTGDATLIAEGLSAARKAAALDQSCLRAHYAIAYGHVRLGAMHAAGRDIEADFAAAQVAAMRLRELDASNHAAYAILGHIAMRRHEHDAALADLVEAHRLNPNDVTTLRWLSWEESNHGLAAPAMDHAELALRLSPRDRAIDLGYWTLGLAAYVAQEFEAARTHAQRAVSLNPAFRGHRPLLIAALVELERRGEAEAHADELLAREPAFFRRRLEGRTFFARPDLEARYVRALRVAARDARAEPPASSDRSTPSEPHAAVSAADSPAIAALTAREIDVLRLVAGGLSNRDIGERLGLSDHTVKRHVANILAKLDLPSRAAAAALAARHGIT